MPNLRYLRGYNDAVVLEHARSGSLTRGELAERSGLTPQAVSKIVNRLVAEGLLTRSGTRNVGVGKPRTLLSLVPDSRLALGAQVERDGLRVVLTDLTGAIVDRATAPLPPSFDPATFVHVLAELVEKVGADDRVLGLGIGFLGPLDHRTEMVHYPTNLAGWQDVPLRTLAEQRLGLPVVVDKDTTAAVLAESWRRGEQLRDAALVFVGTGIGTGLLLDGRVHRGPRSNAGELGHTTVQLDGPPCACGRTGCVEAVHNRAVADGEPAFAASVLATAVADLVQLLDIDHVVLAGRAVLAAPQLYLTSVRATTTQDTRTPAEIEVTSLGDDLVAAGAAMLVLNEFYGRPR